MKTFMLAVEFMAVILGLVSLCVGWMFLQARSAKEKAFDFASELGAVEFLAKKDEQCREKALIWKENRIREAAEKQLKKDKETINAARVNVQ